MIEGDQAEVRMEENGRMREEEYEDTCNEHKDDFELKVNTAATVLCR